MDTTGLMDTAEERVAMLVVSCDRYADLWEPCFRLLDKHWPDRSMDVFLMTNQGDFEWPGVTVMKVGEDISYADNLRAAVERLPHQWILVWLEDLFVSGPVDDDRVMEMIRAAQRRGAGYLKLSPDMPLSYDDEGAGEIGSLPRGVRYRAAIGASLYHRATLMRLLVPGASAWELDKSQLCDDLAEDFMALTVRAARRPPIPYVNALIKGRWSFGSRRCREVAGVEPGSGHRRRESLASLAYRLLFVARLNLLKSFRLHWR